MFSPKSLGIITISILFSACSVTKSLYKDKQVNRYNPNASTVDKDYSNPEESEQEEEAMRSESSRTELLQAEEAACEGTPMLYEPLPKYEFGNNESEHVRIPINLNNPFPSSGELVIPLDQLEKDFCYPYPGKQISPYGYRGRSMHTGVDIKAIPNDTIRAAFSGVVRMSKPYSGYGNIIVIRHYNGIETAYAHNSRNLVKVNDVVKAGDPIALAGRTGRATTEHLHFEFRVASQALNPNLLIDTENRTLQHHTLYLYNRGGTVKASTQPLDASTLASEQRTEENTSSVSINSSTATSSNKSAHNSSKAVYHRIRKGETLSHLARKYSTTVAKICRLNNIKPTTILQINQRLRVK